MSAHPASQRRSWISALVAQVADYVFEPIEETIEAEPVELEPHPVIAVVSAAPRSGATTVARLLAAELATRADGAAVVTSSSPARRSSPPSRAAMRLVTALTGAADAHACGRLCLATRPDARAARDAHSGPPDPAALVNAARYLAPVVLDVAPDGSAAGVAAIVDRIAIVGSASGEPALLDAVATILGGGPLKVVNRVGEADDWETRADIVIPDSRLAARAAAMGTRALGPLGSAIARLADALEGA